jgi:hypothetical protein
MAANPLGAHRLFCSDPKQHQHRIGGVRDLALEQARWCHGQSLARCRGFALVARRNCEHRPTLGENFRMSGP